MTYSDRDRKRINPLLDKEASGALAGGGLASFQHEIDQLVSSLTSATDQWEVITRPSSHSGKRDEEEAEHYQQQLLCFAQDFQLLYKEEKARRRMLEMVHLEMARGFGAAIEARDAYTHGHTSRVTAYALVLGKDLGFNNDEMRVLEFGGHLHDIGKIGVPDAILTKQGRLARKEYDVMKLHPELGSKILSEISFFHDIVPIVRHHHEHYDGRGYPYNLAGDDIPLAARIIAIADTFDAMTSNRPYRRGMEPELAIAEIMRCCGSQFDPQITQAFVVAWRNGRIRLTDE